MAGANMLVSAATKKHRDEEKRYDDKTQLAFARAQDLGGMSGANSGNKYLAMAAGQDLEQRQSDANPPINPIGLALQTAGNFAGGALSGSSSSKAASPEASFVPEGSANLASAPHSLGTYDEFMGDGVKGFDPDDDYWKDQRNGF